MNSMTKPKVEKQRICFIINPKSGKQKTGNLEDLIHSNIDLDRYELSVEHTRSEGHAKQLSQKAVNLRTDIIVAVGGDGTINEVASQLINTNSILGIVPSGSGNGLARHLGIPLKPEKALLFINKAKSTKIDTATLNQHRFISIAGVGFDAFVAEAFSKSRNRGFSGYFKIVAEKFLKYKEEKFQLIFDNDHTKTASAFIIAFANSNQFGYNTQIAPNALLNDGKLDICIVKKPPISEMPNIASLMLLKKIDQSKYVEIIQASEVTVKRIEDGLVNLDGESMTTSKNINIKVDPLSLNVIIP